MSTIARAPLGGRRLAWTTVLVAVAAVFLLTLVGAAGSGRLASDFQAGYFDAAESLRENGTPWDADAEFPYLYTPLLAELFVPLTFLPEDLAAFLAFLASFAAVMGALAIVGVRDIRCYAAVVIWAPAWNVFELANFTAALTLLSALAWRYRDTTWASASAIGFAIAVKLLLWPLLVWFAATRRVRTAGLAVGIALGLVFVSWGIIGFAGFTSYPDVLGEIPFEDSFSIVGVAAALGLDPMVGRAAAAIAGGALLAAVVVLGRRGDEVGAFTCAIVAALALTPVVWLNYVVLLSVPLAIARPRFSAIWLLPIVLWVCPRDGHGDGLQPYLPAAVVLLLLAALVTGPREHRLPAEAPT
jgi:Glycosyltransferase family 87